MKCELMTEKADEVFTEYTLGPQFIDFCRGPHLPDTSRIKAFKLLSVAGAYWKGDEHNKQLQRIYGTAWFTPKEQEAYLKQVEEAKKRDHRKLGKELDLFSIQELAGPGLIFFHPKGGIIRKTLEDWMRDQYLKRGYSLVYTPHIAPLDQIESEVVDCLQFAIDTLQTYGFNKYEAELSTWDGGASGKYAGTAEQWALAENALQRAADKLNVKAKFSPDEAAFYGPKID